MEKYRQYGDAGTGCHPFVPRWQNHPRPSILLRLFKLLIVPIALLRFLLFSVAVLWLALAELIGLLIPIGVVRRPIYRLLTYIGCLVALLALGIISNQDELADHRRLKLAPSKTNDAKVFDARRGSFVFVNHQGMTDILLLGLKLSLLGALKRAMSINKEVAPAKSADTLIDIANRAKSSWQQVVVFPEGGRTIGNCVLAWKAKTFEGVKSFTVDTALLSIQYKKTGSYTAHHTVGSGLAHIFWMCMQMPSAAQTIWLPASDVATALKGKEITEQIALLRTVLVRMIKDAVEVAVGYDTWLEFLAYWNDAQKKSYTKKKA